MKKQHKTLSENQCIIVYEESFPWIKKRLIPDAYPKYKIISRSMSKSYNSIVMIHIAGTCYVRNYYMKELLEDEQILKNMDKKDIELIKWVISSENTDPYDDIKKGKQKLVTLD